MCLRKSWGRQKLGEGVTWILRAFVKREKGCFKFSRHTKVKSGFMMRKKTFRAKNEFGVDDEWLFSISMSEMGSLRHYCRILTEELHAEPSKVEKLLGGPPLKVPLTSPHCPIPNVPLKSRKIIFPGTQILSIVAPQRISFFQSPHPHLNKALPDSTRLEQYKKPVHNWSHRTS